MGDVENQLPEQDMTAASETMEELLTDKTELPGTEPGSTEETPAQEALPEDTREPAASDETQSAEETVAASSETLANEEDETAEETVLEERIGYPGSLPEFIDGFCGGGWLYAAAALLAVLAVRIICRLLKGHIRRKKQTFAATEAYPVPLETTVVNDAELPENGSRPSASAVRAEAFQNIGAREEQQDSYGISEPGRYASQGIFSVVADGMGGLSNGKAVSSALVYTCLQDFGNASPAEQAADLMLRIASHANAQIDRMLQGAARSGSTLVAAMVRDGYLYFITAGDSHIYLYRGGGLILLNREHVYREELALKAVNGAVELTRVEADRQAHALTSYFGTGRLSHLDRNVDGLKLVPGDRILLCSDGVFNTLSSDQLEQALSMDLRAAAKWMESQIRLANLPYQDNNTGVLLEYMGQSCL